MEVDYALIITIAALLGLLIRYRALLTGFRDLLIAALFFTLPSLGLYVVLRTIFALLGIMTF